MESILKDLSKVDHIDENIEALGANGCIVSEAWKDEEHEELNKCLYSLAIASERALQLASLRQIVNIAKQRLHTLRTIFEVDAK